jgi:hypothetical protein
MVSPGDVAGSKGTRYWQVQYKGVKYRCHRVVWELIKGEVPEKIDHKDGDSFNNIFSNLRDGTQRENCENRKMSSANTSGVTGIHAASTGFVAHTKFKGVRKSKFFPYKRHGVMLAFRLACEARDSMIQELNQQGACYTERHGK